MAKASADSINAALTVRRFDDCTEEGVGFLLPIPENVTNMTMKIISRAHCADTSGTEKVQVSLYKRKISLGSEVEAWSSRINWSNFGFGTTTYFVSNTTTNTLSSLGLTAGDIYQFELTRDTGGVGGTDNLDGDWDLLELIVEFGG